MIPLSQFFDFYARRQYEFTLGWQTVGQFAQLLTFETFAMVFCDKFSISGIPALLIYIGVPIAAVIAMIYLGHLMIRSGYANKLQKFGWDINEEWAETVSSVRKIAKKMCEEENRTIK
jgi:hypothetical protein